MTRKAQVPRLPLLRIVLLTVIVPAARARRAKLKPGMNRQRALQALTECSGRALTDTRQYPPKGRTLLGAAHRQDREKLFVDITSEGQCLGAFLAYRLQFFRVDSE